MPKSSYRIAVRHSSSYNFIRTGPGVIRTRVIVPRKYPTISRKGWKHIISNGRRFILRVMNANEEVASTVKMPRTTPGRPPLVPPQMHPRAVTTGRDHKMSSMN
jgi:hypothetical protein